VIFDLSVVTDTLTNLVSTAWPGAPLWTDATRPFAVDVTGLSPDSVRLGQGAQLSLYLYHVDENNAQESLFWTAQSQAAGGPPLKYQPLALDLYYLLSAYAQGSYIQEQQAMSVAMRVFHENPLVRGLSVDGLPWEVTLTLERRSYDELSRLWQATTSAMRLSAVYRAAVVLIEPEPGAAAAPPVAQVGLSVEPGVAGMLLGTQREVRYPTPGGATVNFVQDPATVAAGGTVILVGTGFDTLATKKLMVTGPAPDSPETDVSAWLPAAPQPAPATLLTVKLPAATGTPPDGAPVPGRYSVRLEGTTTTGGRAVSTASVPLVIAPGVSPAGGPVLAMAASYNLAGTGFTPGATEILLGTVPLQAADGASPAAGQFAVNQAGTALTLVPPGALRTGTYQVRVLVAGIEADPALWLAAP
jgi:hypothetical protein